MLECSSISRIDLLTTRENLSDNGELENNDNSILCNLQHCDCENDTEFEFCLVKQNTVEEFECSWYVRKVNLKSSIPVVKATTCLRSAIRNFVVLSFLVNGQYFKDDHKIFGALGLDHVSSTQWIHIVEWIAPFAKGSPTEACKKQKLKQFDVEISHH